MGRISRETGSYNSRMEIKSIDALSIRRGLTRYGCFFLAKYDVPVGATSNMKCRQFLLPVSMSNLANYWPPSSQEYELTEVLFNEALVPLWVYRLMKPFPLNFLMTSYLLACIQVGKRVESGVNWKKKAEKTK